MSKTLKKNVKRSSNNYFDDGYHSKQFKRSLENRKQLKHLDNALRSKNLDKILAYEGHEYTEQD